MPPPPACLAAQLLATAEVLQRVLQGRSLTEALPAALARHADLERSGVQALSFAALRHLGPAAVLLEMLAERRPQPPLRALLLTALALAWPDDAGHTPYPAHTLVDQSVAAARRLAPASAGFVNALLRRWFTEQQALQSQALRHPEARWRLPGWWVNQVQADWGADAPRWLGHARRRAPMALRVNTRRLPVQAYRQALQAAGLQAQPPGAGEAAAAAEALLLAAPCPVQALPGWNEGWVSVQDVSAQRAAPLLLGRGTALPPLTPGARVLDACAAPGGKTAHLLELAELDVLALDADAQRLARVEGTLQRLGLAAELRCADARDTSHWWDGRPFDAILLDAPCTASGIVRRHPDIPWLRRPADIAALAALQAQLLQALWPLLKPGGRLLYATCAIFKAEGERQIDAFLQRETRARARWVKGSPGHVKPLAENSQPAPPVPDAEGDGFYLALLQRVDAAA